MLYNCTTNKLLEARKNATQVDPIDIIKSNMDVIAILGDAFVELPHHRREAIKLNLKKAFVSLRSEKVPFTTNLFSDDLQAECHNIKTLNKLNQSASHGRDIWSEKIYG